MFAFAQLFVIGLLGQQLLASPIEEKSRLVKEAPAVCDLSYAITQFATFQAPVTANSTISFRFTNPNALVPSTSIVCSHSFAPGQGGPTSGSYFLCADNLTGFRYATANILEISAQYYCGGNLLIGYAKGQVPTFAYPLNGGILQISPVALSNLVVTNVTTAAPFPG